jgi:F-type H+-transporting ATPase subunit alpha
MVREFEKEFVDLLEVKYRSVLDELKAGKLTDEIIATLEKVGAEVASKYKA